MPDRTQKKLMGRLKAAGFDSAFVRMVVFPDWWDDSCTSDASLMDDLEFRVSRFLDLPIASVRDPTQPIQTPPLGGARLRRTRDVEEHRLLPSIYAGTQIAKAAARNLRGTGLEPRLPPVDPLLWREQLNGAERAVDLELLVEDLWHRGIPVLHATRLPSPKYQGMACIVENRPTIVLGRAHDELPRLAFLVAHEAAHLAHRDCEPGAPVVDEDEAVDASEIERRADHYAWTVIAGEIDVPDFTATAPRDIALEAEEFASGTGVDAGFAIWSWANRRGAFQTAAMALGALYLHKGGGAILARAFQANVDVESASESDRLLLGCVGVPSAGTD